MEAGTSPDAVTFAGLAAAVAAGASFAAGSVHPAWWLVVPLAVVARLAANALDGSIARRTGSARPEGLVLNEMVDRIADVAVISGAGVAGGALPAAAALTASLLASFAGVVPAAAGRSRDYSGPMGKADRMAVLALAALSAVAAGPGAITVGLWVVAAGAAVTAAARTGRALRRDGDTSDVR